MSKPVCGGNGLASAYAGVCNRLVGTQPDEELLTMKRELEHRMAEEFMEEWGWERTDTGLWKKIENDEFWKRWKNAAVEELIEETTVAAFMEQYAAALDAGVDAVMEECVDDEFPPELDARCRALIEQAVGEKTDTADAEDLTFKSSLTMEEIEQNFEGVDLFSELMDALEEALVYSKGKEDLIDPGTGIKLTPSPGGRECLGNGNWVGYEICCDECDHFFTCFPEANMSY